MSFFNYIDNNFINPLKSVPLKIKYNFKKNYKTINTDKRDFHIVVSLTSFPARFNTLHYAVKSILEQKLKPDVIMLCLARDEIKNENELPQSILELKKYGLSFYFSDINLKPHNKYFYSMRQYPKSLIITVDDDNIYDRNLISDLYASYIKYPKAVSSKRVHKILCDKNNTLLPYSKWPYEYKKETTPSFDLIATGVGGVLYPPGLFNNDAFDEQKIRELCLNADDIWLKFMELKNNIPVVWVKSGRIHPLRIKKAQKITLNSSNFHKNQNDEYINNLQNYYNINIGLVRELG
jgi:hypothetical protein